MGIATKTKGRIEEKAGGEGDVDHKLCSSLYTTANNEAGPKEVNGAREATAELPPRPVIRADRR
jgi:hypothetical protein